MSLSRADFLQIFTPAVPRVYPVELPGGHTVFVREFSAHERTQFELSISDKHGGIASCRERLVVLCACDEKGERLFDDKDVSTVGRALASGIDPIVNKAREVNGLDVKPREEVVKNSETSTNGD